MIDGTSPSAALGVLYMCLPCCRPSIPLASWSASLASTPTAPSKLHPIFLSCSKITPRTSDRCFSQTCFDIGTHPSSSHSLTATPPDIIPPTFKPVLVQLSSHPHTSTTAANFTSHHNGHSQGFPFVAGLQTPSHRPHDKRPAQIRHLPKHTAAIRRRQGLGQLVHAVRQQAYAFPHILLAVPADHSDSSAVSTNGGGLHLQTILNSQDSPTRFSTGSTGTPKSTRMPSYQVRCANSGTSSTDRQNSLLSSINQTYDQRGSMASSDARASLASTQSLDPTQISFLDSRRSSIDSRVNVALGPTSPYEASNASQTSLASTLQRERGIQMPRPNGALSPMASRTSLGRTVPVPAVGRRAPVITSNPRSGNMPDPHAPAPTPGFAWAFPTSADPDDLDDDDDISPDTSRHGSVAGSSIHTLESGYSTRRYGDGETFACFVVLTDDADHHPLPHRSISNLQGDQSGTGNYSRTPELRVSHKLAERKRRSEMKDLFEQLNRGLPNSPGNKSSKWEILSKVSSKSSAVRADNVAAIEYNAALKQAYDSTSRELEKLRAESEHARRAVEDNANMSGEILAMYQQLMRVDPKGYHVFGARTQALAAGHGQHGGHGPAAGHGHAQDRGQENGVGPGRLGALGASHGPPQGQAPVQAQAQGHGSASMQGHGQRQDLANGAMQGVEYSHGYDRR
ncbi:hypothetical protein MRB53_036961 [Persea americana]|nr:hypothetical protein MRB53_036961 [Persea americana]